METVFLGYTISPICFKSKFKLRNHLKAWKKRKKRTTKTTRKPTQHFIERQSSAISFSESFENKKGLQWGLPAQVGFFSQMCNTGQIWIDLECAVLLVNDVFPLLGFQKPRVQSFTTTFLCRSKLTTTLLEKDVSQCVWLFVSLLCSLEKKDCKGKKSRKWKTNFLCIFSWRSVCLKNSNPKAGYLH